MVRIERIRAQKLYKKGRGGVSPPVSHRLMVNWIAKLVVYGAGAETHSFGAVWECPLLIPLVGFHLVFFFRFFGILAECIWPAPAALVGCTASAEMHASDLFISVVQGGRACFAYVTHPLVRIGIRSFP